MNGQMQFADLLKNQQTLLEIEQISKESRDVEYGIWEQIDADNRNILKTADQNIKVDHAISGMIDGQTKKFLAAQSETKKLLERLNQTVESIYKSVDTGSPTVTGSSVGKMQEFYKTVSTKVISGDNIKEESTVNNRNLSNLSNFATVVKNASTFSGFGTSPDQAKASMITPREEKIDQVQGAEARDEQVAAVAEQTELLKKIEENTRKPSQDGGKPEEKVKPKGLFEGIFDGLKSAFAAIFSPRALLKSLARFAIVPMLIGSLVNGLVDGFVAWQQTGSIKEALIVGLGGILEFLSFGLFDAETIRGLVESVSGMYDEYIAKPIESFIDSVTGVFQTVSDFFTSAIDDFMGMIRSIGIPEMKFTIPLINKEVTIGPYYPFAESGGESKPTGDADATAASPVVAPSVQPVAPAPVAANAVYNQSAENAEATTTNSAVSNTVVAPTTINNKNERVSFKNNTRNQDSSYSSLIQSRFVPV